MANNIVYHTRENLCSYFYMLFVLFVLFMGDIAYFCEDFILLVCRVAMPLLLSVKMSYVKASRSSKFGPNFIRLILLSWLETQIVYGGRPACVHWHAKTINFSREILYEIKLKIELKKFLMFSGNCST